MEDDTHDNSFSAASDANDSLEPGELKLTPPQSPCNAKTDIIADKKPIIINHTSTLDDRFIRKYDNDGQLSSLDTLKNYHNDDMDGNVKYYDNRKGYHNNKRNSLSNNQGFYNYREPNYRNNRNFKNRNFYVRGGGRQAVFFQGRNKNMTSRNYAESMPPEQQPSRKKYSTKSSNSVMYTKTKPSIPWQINSNYSQKSKKLRVSGNACEEDKNELSKNVQREHVQVSSTTKGNSLKSPIRHRSKTRSIKSSKLVNSVEKTTIVDAKVKSHNKRRSESKIHSKKEPKLSDKCKIDNSKNDRKTPPVIKESGTPESNSLTIENQKKLIQHTESNVNSTSIKNPIKDKDSSNISSKKMKNSKEKKNNKLNPHALSFADDFIFDDDDTRSSEIFPLSKDESVCAKNNVQDNKLTHDVVKKSTNNNCSPDTDEYQDMWEEEEELTSSQISGNIKIENESPKEIDQNQPKVVVENNFENDGSSEDSSDILKTIKIKIDEEIKEVKNMQDSLKEEISKNYERRIKEEIEMENEFENADDNSNKSEEEDIKDGLGTPIFVNPSPPPYMSAKEERTDTPENNSISPSRSINSMEKFDISSENNPDFKPSINPNQKFLFGMQDIYEQFLQSVSNAGIDLSSDTIIKRESDEELENNESPGEELENNESPGEELENNESPGSASQTTSLTDSMNGSEIYIESINPNSEDEDSDSSDKDSNSSSTSSSSSSDDDSDSSDSSSESSTSSDDSDSDDSDKSDNSSIADTKNFTQHFGVAYYFSREDKKQLRELQERLETLKGWRANDDDDYECFLGLEKALESGINLLKRKYMDVRTDESNSTATENESLSVTDTSSHDDKSGELLDSNREIIKMKIFKIQSNANKCWPVPIPQIFSIEEEIAKVAQPNITDEYAEKMSKPQDRSRRSEGSLKNQHIKDSMESSVKNIRNRTPDRHLRDSNSSSKARREQSSPSVSPPRSRGRSSQNNSSRHRSGSNHGGKSRWKYRRSRSRSHTSPKRFRGDSPFACSRRQRRSRDSKKSSRDDFYRRSYSRSRSRSRSRSNSRPRFGGNRRSSSPYSSRRFSRSPPFRPPSPPPSLHSRGDSRSRSNSPRQHIQRLSPNRWNRDDSICHQYYPTEEYSYALSPNRMPKDARITEELNHRPIAGVIQSYQSYTQFNSYNDYMPSLHLANQNSQFHNNPYAVGYQQNVHTHGSQQPYNSAVGEFESTYYYNANQNEYQQNACLQNNEGFRQDNIKSNHNDINCGKNSVSSVAVQKGNVLEIVPASTVPPGYADLPVPIGKIKQEANVKKSAKRKMPSWKEEINQRQVLAAVLKINRETSGTVKSILSVRSTDSTIPPKQKKKVLFADGIRPGHGPIDEKSSAYKKEKKIRRGNRERKRNSMFRDNKENEHLELINRAFKIDFDAENAPPPLPPPGSPPPFLEQPLLVRPSSPDQFLYFHFDPVVNSMYVSQIPNAIPPRLLNRGTHFHQPIFNKSSSIHPPPGMPSVPISIPLNGGTPFIKAENRTPLILPAHHPHPSPNNHFEIPTIGGAINTPDKFKNRTSGPSSAAGNSFASALVGMPRFHNVSSFQKNLGPQNTSMSSCNFAMPPPITNQLPVRGAQSLSSQRSPTVDQLKRVSATLPFKPAGVHSPSTVSDNTPAFSSDSAAAITFFKKEPGLSDTPPPVISPMPWNVTIKESLSP